MTPDDVIPGDQLTWQHARLLLTMVIRTGKEIGWCGEQADAELAVDQITRNMRHYVNPDQLWKCPNCDAQRPRKNT